MVALKDWGCAWQEEQQRISNQEAVRDEWFCLLKDALASVNRLSRPAAQPGMHSRGPTLMDKGAPIFQFGTPHNIAAHPAAQLPIHCNPLDWPAHIAPLSFDGGPTINAQLCDTSWPLKTAALRHSPRCRMQLSLGLKGALAVV